MSEPNDSILHAMGEVVHQLSDETIEDVLYDDAASFETNTTWIENLGEIMDEDGLR